LFKQKAVPGIRNGFLLAAPLTAQFPNQLFEDFRKLYELKPFINVDGYSSLYRASKGSPRKDNALDSHSNIKPYKGYASLKKDNQEEEGRVG
jgi:hypothetical protein